MASIYHTDNHDRDSFVYDVMDAVRPDVEAWLLEFMQNHTFSARDFYKKRDGGIRLTLKITPFLAETIPLWTSNIEPVLEKVKAILLDDKSQKKSTTAY